MPKWQRWKGIMKCYPFEEKRLAKWEPPYIVQPKYDGVRCRAVPLDTGHFMLLSSEENVIHSVPHINVSLRHLPGRLELDGELYAHGMSFEEIVSITSRTVNIRNDGEAIKYHIFDTVNSMSQMARLVVIETLSNRSPWIEVAPFWLCESLEDVMRAYDIVIERGYEGIIVRHKNAPYERKRSTFVMKFKPKKEDSYEIDGFSEEISISGVPKDSLGALTLRDESGSTFNCGTGFTAEQRSELWKVREDLRGKKAVIKYQHLTDRKVPRFPVFVEITDT